MNRTIRKELRSLLLLSACAGIWLAAVHSAAAQDPGRDETMSITTAEERGSMPGGDDYFTGETTISMLFVPNGPRDFSGATVTFQPGARTAWHSHPAGQTLVVTEGSGWIQMQGGERRDLKPGDVVWTPPGVRHWHGATEFSAMTHTALQGSVDGTGVNWFEQVSDAQYLGTKER